MEVSLIFSELTTPKNLDKNVAKEVIKMTKNMLIGLAIINPIYFTCMMVGAMKTIKISLSIILGTILGPAFYFISPEWCILFGGFVAGTIAFFIGEINDR